MSRIGWNPGRFTVDYETESIYKGLRDWQRWTGDDVFYYRFAYDQSNKDSVYDEATSSNGRIYFGPNQIPALHVIHVEGDNQNTVNGFYFNDDAHVTLSYDQLARTGLERMDITTKNYLKDRFIYDDKVFRVTNVQILGQIQKKDIIVTIDGTQVKPEELTNDIQFAQYARNVPLPKNYNPTTIDRLGMHKEMQQIVPVLHGPSTVTEELYGYGEFGYGENGYGGVL